MAQEENHFKIVSKFKPTGDQPQAIEQLTNGFQSGEKISNITWCYRFW